MVTYYVVQSFQAGNKGYLIADEPREASGPGQAKLWASRLAGERAGVIAFSRTGDPVTGDYAEAEVICSFGELPDAIFEMAS